MIMQKKRTLTMVGFLALLIALPLLTGVLAKSGFELRISALEDDTPRNVVVSDVRDTSFRVSWITERSVIGGVVLSDGSKFLENDASSYHTITVTNVSASTSYLFKVMSGTKEFGKEEGDDYSVTTASVASSGEKFLVYGQVFSPDGYSFQQGGVITLQLYDGAQTSQVLSAVINEAGGYQFDLGGMLVEDLNATFSYTSKSDATFNVYISHTEGPVEKRYTVDFAINRQVPNLYLGEASIDLLPAIEGD